MKHQKQITHYNGSNEQLWEDIGDLDYDSLVELFSILNKKFSKDAVHDLELWHPKVSEHLQNIATWLAKILQEDIQPLADLCRKYNEKGIR
jgi:hypothetical protein